MAENLETVTQIDCNNPEIDFAVIATFGEESEPVTTSAGRTITADQTDEVPYSCPLTRGEGKERPPEDFIEVCADCSHAFISYAVGYISVR